MGDPLYFETQNDFFAKTKDLNLFLLSKDSLRPSTQEINFSKPWVVSDNFMSATYKPMSGRFGFVQSLAGVKLKIMPDEVVTLSPAVYFEYGDHSLPVPEEWISVDPHNSEALVIQTVGGSRLNLTDRDGLILLWTEITQVGYVGHPAFRTGQRLKFERKAK